MWSLQELIHFKADVNFKKNFNFNGKYFLKCKLDRYRVGLLLPITRQKVWQVLKLNYVHKADYIYTRFNKSSKITLHLKDKNSRQNSFTWNKKRPLQKKYKKWSCIRPCCHAEISSICIWIIQRQARYKIASPWIWNFTDIRWRIFQRWCQMQNCDKNHWRLSDNSRLTLQEPEHLWYQNNIHTFTHVFQRRVHGGTWNVHVFFLLVYFNLLLLHHSLSFWENFQALPCHNKLVNYVIQILSKSLDAFR